jgi:hypothetical protein
MSARKFWLQEENYMGDKPILISNTAGMGELEKKAAECNNINVDETPEKIELSQYMRNDFDNLKL